MSEEQNKGRGARGAFDQERETRNQCQESESRGVTGVRQGKGGGDRVPTVRTLPVANV